MTSVSSALFSFPRFSGKQTNCSSWQAHAQAKHVQYSVNFGIQDHNGEGGELTKTRSYKDDGMRVAKTFSDGASPLAHQRVSPVTMA